VKNINDVKKVVITDNREHDSRFSNDGGAYSFSTEYIRIENSSIFEVVYSTSSSLQFCSVCGTFGCTTCTEEERKKVFLNYILAEIARYIKNDDFEIELEF
jgi:hypothetical protein